MNFPFLLSHGFRNILGDTTKLILYSIFGIFVIAYFLSPIDIIPDVVGIIGYLDDFLVFVLFIYGIIGAFYTAFNEFNQFEFNRIRNQ